MIEPIVGGALRFHAGWIALEGGDGAGKTEQAGRLAAALRRLGYGAIHVREPGGTPAAEAIRGLVLSDLDMAPEETLLLMMAARASLYRQHIRPALSSGSVVVSERSFLSSVVYQGLLGGLGAREVIDAHRWLFPVLPVSVVLDVPAHVMGARRGAGEDRIDKSVAHQRERLRAYYLDAAETMGPACTVVDGMGSIETVTWRLVAAALGKMPGGDQILSASTLG